MRTRRWSMASIRLRMLAGLLTLLVIGMVATTATGALLLQRFLDDRSAETLESSAGRVQEVLARGPQTADAEQLSALLGPPLGIVVIDARGTVGTSTGAAEQAPEKLVEITATRPGRIVAYDGEELPAFLAIRIPSPELGIVQDDGRVVATSALVLVIDSSVDDGAARQLLLYQALLTLALLIVLAGLALVVLRVGLRPLSRMAVTADAIAAGSLAERLPVEERPTEADGLARAVNRAFDAQARAEATARTFAADASHELRTPLATISGWLDLYHQGALADEDIGEAVGHIDAEVGRMRLIVEELGLLARLDAGRPVERADVDLVGLAASVVEDAQVIDPDRDITLIASTPVHVSGDAPRLFQVLRNLVGNAVQHTPAGTPVRITVDTSVTGARMTVSDDGPGIAAEHLPRVFERFWRAEASRSRAYGGSGLGLAIVEAIVHAHGGTVAVRSATSGTATGTTIVVELPAPPVAPGQSSRADAR